METVSLILNPVRVENAALVEERTAWLKRQTPRVRSYIKRLETWLETLSLIPMTQESLRVRQEAFSDGFFAAVDPHFEDDASEAAIAEFTRLAGIHRLHLVWLNVDASGEPLAEVLDPAFVDYIFLKK